MKQLPMTVTVADNGAVSIETSDTVTAMSPFSSRAVHFAREFGAGVHKIETFVDVQDLPGTLWSDLMAAVS